MTRTYFFLTNTSHLTWKFHNMYDTWFPIAVELTDEEFARLSEAWNRWYNDDEFEAERKNPCIDDEEYFIHKFVPDIHKKVKCAFNDQLPKIFGEDIRPEINNADVFCPKDIDYYTHDDSEKFDTLFLIKDDGKTLKECNINAEGEVVIPNGITTISLSAFTYCSRIKKVVVPDSVTDLGHLTFNDCYSLETVVLPDSIDTIGLSDFDTCWNLREINIPKSVKLIEKFAFGNCANLKNISIPESVERIDPGAFEYCRALERLCIKSPKCDIDSSAFMQCTGLKEIHLYLEDISNVGDVFKDIDKAQCKLFVPDDFITVYREHPCCKDFKEVVSIV